MKKSQLIIILALTVLLLALNLLTRDDLAGKEYFGGLPWYGWAGISLFLLVVGVAFALRDAARARRLLEEPPTGKKSEADERIYLSKELLEKYDPDGPNYPHPVIVTERCIGCHACVDACPHDVLAIVNGVSTPIARDQCMEDTSCQVECPVNPKACIVVNTQKKIQPRKVPARNASFETNVPGVYIIGDVSGTPLIKNAANEGAAVAVHVAHELHARDGNGGPPAADYDVAIVGAGPAGLSCAVMAKKLGLKYVAVEQDTVMSTIVKYPKGKYVFLKPETMEWTGGIRLPGLEEYVEETLEEIADGADKARMKELLAAERGGTIDAAGQKTLDDTRTRYQQLLEEELTGKLDADGRARLESARRKFEALLDAEDKYLVAELLADEAAGKIKPEEVAKMDKINLARQLYGDRVQAEIDAGKLADERYQALSDARHKVAGDQREVLLNTWFMNMKENGVVVNENESCKSVKKAEDGDYFVMQTARAGETQTYKARRIVLAIGTAGTPMKLRVPGEELKVTRDGVTDDKVKYKLADPDAYKRKRIVVVGAGNSAIEGAVDLVARRQGDRIMFRGADETNEVTLVIRSDLKNDLKFGNKIQVYDCIDEGRIKVYFGAAIKEIRDDEVVLMNARTQEEKATLKNDYVFAMIGGDKPTKFLEAIGIKIG
ncbi:MAG TPA: NAD(P)-binding domain-containing protein [Pyrinomonadaceae bacterium]|jgi:thioredoxin reductase